MADSPHRPLFDIHRLAGLLGENDLLLTPNQRLASKIGQAWNQHCQQQGWPVWSPLPVLAIDAWIDECWLALQDRAYPPALSGSRISPDQERLLWQAVLEQDDEAGAGFSPTAYVSLAEQGWRLAGNWQLSASDLHGQHHPGAEKLASWGEQHEALLEQRQLVSTVEATQIVLKGFREQTLPQYNRVILVGFQSLPLLQQSLISAASGNHSHLPHPEPVGQCRVHAASTADDELEAAALWAHTLCNTDRSARIGIVIGDLASRRDQVERIFQNLLDPATALPDSPYRPPAFNLSAGTPLYDTPLVASALQLLKLGQGREPLEFYLRLLDDPFWGCHRPATEQVAVRSKAHWLLREAGQLHLDVGEFRTRLARAETLLSGPGDPQGSDSLSARLTAVSSAHRQQRKNQSFSAWRLHFLEKLQKLGWPGQRSLNSLEYQQHSAFCELLDHFAALDMVAEPVPMLGAISHLRQMARDRVFHAETPDSNIQILGQLEAAGLQFSHLWVTGLDDGQWPRPTRSHPLLPVPMQQKLAMPRASARRELELSKALFDLFSRSGQTVVFSYCRNDGDRQLLPSQLVAGLPPLAPDWPPAPCSGLHPWTRAVRRSAALEAIEDAAGPPLSGAHGVRTAKLRGGSRLLQDQAACPFNAFATWRLGATPLPEPQPGPDALVRGNLVHGVLEAFWRELPDRQTLVHLPPAELQARIAAAVGAALQGARLVNTGPRYRDLERERLTALLIRWLEFERQRSDFRILGLETAAQVQFAGYRLVLRIDRIDLLADGRRLLMDYKTGAAGVGRLGRDRLLEPQLPLYALADRQSHGDDGLGAIVYAMVGAGEGRWDGISDGRSELRGLRQLSALGLPSEFESTLDRWSNQLIKLLNEHLSGDAEVIFYDTAAMRRQAHLNPLNRIAGAGEVRAWLTAAGRAP